MSVLYLDPGEEQIHCIHVVVLGLPECQKFKISIDIGLIQQFAEQFVHFHGAENIKYDGDNGELERREMLMCFFF